MAKTVKETFKPKECLRLIQNLFASPEYTKLKIGMRAYIKLMCYCHLAGEQEITGLGRIKNNEILDFKIPYQQVTGTTADATDEDIINLMREIDLDEIKEWCLDWHSHVDMQTFVSATDEANYELMSMARGGKQFPIMVVNKKGSFCLKNFIHEGRCPDIALEFDKSKMPSEKEIENIYNKCKIDVAEKLSMKPIPKSSYTIYGRQQSFNDGYNWSSSKNGNSAWGNDTAEADNCTLCRSCGEPLISATELANGFCDDCLEAFYGRT
jgi:hypothetical protein